MGDIIPDVDDYEKYKALEDLKAQINEQIVNLEGTADEETIEKINKLKSRLKEGASKKTVDENIANLERFNKGLSYFERFKQSFERNIDIDPGRLLGLTDGIFGMVMTLLIFGMALPEMHLVNAGDFLLFVESLAPTIGITLVSFVLLSSFWIYHHEFIKINNLNIPYLWLNIFYLACISFIPFTTSIIGNYSHFFLAEVIFGLNVFLVILTFLMMYRYAYNRGFLEEKPSQEEKKYIYHTFFIIMGLTVVVNLLDYNVSSNFIYLFFLVPVISTIRDIHFRMKS